MRLYNDGLLLVHFARLTQLAEVRVRDVQTVDAHTVNVLPNTAHNGKKK